MADMHEALYDKYLGTWCVYWAGELICDCVSEEVAKTIAKILNDSGAMVV